MTSSSSSSSSGIPDLTHLSVSSENILDMFLESFNQTIYNDKKFCDVCDKDGEHGGYALIFESKNRGLEFVCNHCFDTFCRVSEPMIDTDEKRIAYTHSIGRGFKEYIKMDENEEFDKNVCFIKSKPEIFGTSQFVVKLNDKGFHGHANPDELAEDPKRPCLGCKCMFPKSKLLRCSRCKNAFYCGKQCQKMHWPIHKGKCIGIDIIDSKKEEITQFSK